MAGDDDSDVKQALAVFGAPPIGYRNFRRAPVPAVAPIEPALPPPEPAPTRLTLQWPARSFACRPEASLGGVPIPAQPVPNLRAIPLHRAPSGNAPPRSFARGLQTAQMPAAPHGIRPVPVIEGVPNHGKLPLAEVFRALADAPAAKATSLALPPMFRRL